MGGGKVRMTPISVALIDDHPVLLSGIVDLISSTTGFEVVGKGASAADAIQIASELSPDSHFVRPHRCPISTICVFNDANVLVSGLSARDLRSYAPHL